MRCSGSRSVAADSISSVCSCCRKRVGMTRVSDSCSGENKRRRSTPGVRAAVVELSYTGAPLISKSTGRPCDSVRLDPHRFYTIGRCRRLCDFLLDADVRSVSRQHCRIFLDSRSCKIFIVDGYHADNLLIRNGEEEEKAEEDKKGYGSLNGVFVNGVRCNKFQPIELRVGDEVSLVCIGGRCCSRFKTGFFIRKVVFAEEEGGMYSSEGDLGMIKRSISGSVSCSSKRIFASRSCVDSLGSSCTILRARSLLGHCRHILSSADPISCILRCHINYSGPLVEAPLACNNLPGSNNLTLRKPASPVAEPQCINVLPVQGQKVLSLVSSDDDCNRQGFLHAECSSRRVDSLAKNTTDDGKMSSFISAPIVTVPCSSHTIDKDPINATYQPTLEKNFCLNLLGSATQASLGHRHGISLPELLYPVESISQIFVATFTSNVEWFLSHCQIPTHMPVTIACHDTERCWSANPDLRALIPFPEFPNVEIVYPPFPESIAFGGDRKKQGIACHHPKLIVVQTEDRIRVVISSANLVPKQWISITNTVWWQDFPRRSAPDYMSLFTRITDEAHSKKGSNSDFSAQLAGFMACLVIDIPHQSHWITQLTKYDFQEAGGYLITSVPGIHSYRPQTEPAVTSFSVDVRDISCPRGFDLLTTVEASVVGLSYFFRTSSDSNGAALKKLAAFLLNTRGSASEMREIVLRRNTNVAADPNAVSVLIRDPENFSDGDCIQFGFLPRTVAKWVSPLWDGGFFRFSGYVSPKEVLAAAVGGDNKKVQLILHVFQGPSFPDLPKTIESKHMIALCSLVASMERCIGLSRLQEVVGRYSWPESLETDFVYAASSIGTSVGPQFVAAFSAAAGKRSSVLSESEESDPAWGRWTASQELKNPSVGIIFPTIERVKTAVCGISPSRQILCFSEKTWQKLKTASILHDAVPHPRDRIGHPMHIKVGRRRFKSRTGTSSFGWVYSGSHNFSAAAWGRPVSRRAGSEATRLHVCNYELGIIFVVPPEDKTGGNEGYTTDLDDIELPFVMPAPKYGASDRPATKQAMREAIARLHILESERSEVPLTEEADEIPDEEELVEPVVCVVENEEENAYADMLWSEVDSLPSS